jgi:hypothetical protein
VRVHEVTANVKKLNPGSSHWFYEDWVRDINPEFSSLPLKKFSEMLFRACPLIRHWSADHEQEFQNFLKYKTQVPVCGAIMLNEKMDKVRPVVSTTLQYNLAIRLISPSSF